jgi:hypothetical protein
MAAPGILLLFSHRSGLAVHTEVFPRVPCCACQAALHCCARGRGRSRGARAATSAPRLPRPPAAGAAAGCSHHQDRSRHLGWLALPRQLSQAVEKLMCVLLCVAVSSTRVSIDPAKSGGRGCAKRGCDHWACAAGRAQVSCLQLPLIGVAAPPARGGWVPAAQAIAQQMRHGAGRGNQSQEILASRMVCNEGQPRLTAASSGPLRPPLQPLSTPYSSSTTNGSSMPSAYTRCSRSMTGKSPGRCRALSTSSRSYMHSAVIADLRSRRPLYCSSLWMS